MCDCLVCRVRCNQHEYQAFSCPYFTFPSRSFHAVSQMRTYGIQPENMIIDRIAQKWRGRWTQKAKPARICSRSCICTFLAIRNGPECTCVCVWVILRSKENLRNFVQWTTLAAQKYAIQNEFSLKKTNSSNNNMGHCKTARPFCVRLCIFILFYSICFFCFCFTLIRKTLFCFHQFRFFFKLLLLLLLLFGINKNRMLVCAQSIDSLTHIARLLSVVLCCVFSSFRFSCVGSSLWLHIVGTHAVTHRTDTTLWMGSTEMILMECSTLYAYPYTYTQYILYTLTSLQMMCSVCVCVCIACER